MNLELFIARKIYFERNRGGKKLPPAIRIAITGVALGLAVMILAVAIVIGFKDEIRHKVIGFNSHIQLTSYIDNSSYETHPIAVSDSLFTALSSRNNVARVTPFATKPGILKTDNEFAGVVLKGVDSKFDWTFFKNGLLEGRLPEINDSTPSNEILLSKEIANKLHLGVDDRIYCYFVQENVRARRFTITGIYETNFTEHDELFVIGDIQNIQRLNGWDRDQYSGIEMMLKDFSSLAEDTESLYFDLGQTTDRTGGGFYVKSVVDMAPQIFSWLELLDINTWVILILMTLVAGFTMISGLLIIILERTNMIGILKSLGSNNLSIRKIFLYVSFFLVGKGVLWGNIIGLTICAIQHYGEVIKLDPSVYYIPAVPIQLNALYWVLINVGCVVISMLMLVGPSYLISLIRPAKSIKFE